MEQAVREGMPIPQRIANAPALLPGLELYYLAYVELMTCRQIGMSEGVIPWWVIENWALQAGLDDEQRTDLHYFIGVLDQAYLGHKDRKRKEGKGKSRGKPK